MRKGEKTKTAGQLDNANRACLGKPFLHTASLGCRGHDSFSGTLAYGDPRWQRWGGVRFPLSEENQGRLN